MQLFKLKTTIHRFESFGDFAKTFALGENDLVITNEFLYEPYMKSCALPCRFIMQEKEHLLSEHIQIFIMIYLKITSLINNLKIAMDKPLPTQENW